MYTALASKSLLQRLPALPGVWAVGLLERFRLGYRDALAEDTAEGISAALLGRARGLRGGSCVRAVFGDLSRVSEAVDRPAEPIGHVIAPAVHGPDFRRLGSSSTGNFLKVVIAGWMKTTPSSGASSINPTSR